MCDTLEGEIQMKYKAMFIDDTIAIKDDNLATLDIPSEQEFEETTNDIDSGATGLKTLPRSQKKRLKHELAMQRKRELRKEKRQLQKQRLREESNTEQLRKYTVQPSKKELRVEIKSKLGTAMMCGQRICIDLSMENTMTLKEKSKLAQQLCRLYGVNWRTDVPAHIYFTGFDKKGDLYQECVRKIDGFEKFQLLLVLFQVEMTETSILEMFNIDVVIYLSPDAADMLEDLDKDKVYVIGGIVDESVTKNLSKQKAEVSNIQAFRLPIERYMKKKDQMHFSQVLAINQVFEILVTYLSSRDWKTALSKGVPERKGYVLRE
ncbi:tRNA methyltransferase 10 homolog B-like [Ostrea edulis]|uniref:tRNA methyltransferase 10 homolog B-like n=1 Tax=Ostrea edulis TaxID=37623 RepID=UPI0020952187|nr:tRNA methyltransferase 10 homolog B-like [Ostrea edulis]